MIEQTYFDKIKHYFNGDATKAWDWFNAINPSLGGITPLSMIKLGREKKLKAFIDSRMEGYYP